MDVDNEKLSEISTVITTYNSLESGLFILNSPMIESIIDPRIVCEGVTKNYKQSLNEELGRTMSCFQNSNKFNLIIREIIKLNIQEDRIYSTESLIQNMVNYDKHNGKVREYFYIYSGLLELLSEMLIQDRETIVNLLLS